MVFQQKLLGRRQGKYGGEQEMELPKPGGVMKSAAELSHFPSTPPCPQDSASYGYQSKPQITVLPCVKQRENPSLSLCHMPGEVSISCHAPMGSQHAKILHGQLRAQQHCLQKPALQRGPTQCTAKDVACLLGGRVSRGFQESCLAL